MNTTSHKTSATPMLFHSQEVGDISWVLYNPEHPDVSRYVNNYTSKTDAWQKALFIADTVLNVPDAEAAYIDYCNEFMTFPERLQSWIDKKAVPAHRCFDLVSPIDVADAVMERNREPAQVVSRPVIEADDIFIMRRELGRRPNHVTIEPRANGAFAVLAAHDRAFRFRVHSERIRMYQVWKRSGVLEALGLNPDLQYVRPVREAFEKLAVAEYNYGRSHGPRAYDLLVNVWRARVKVETQARLAAWREEMVDLFTLSDVAAREQS